MFFGGGIVQALRAKADFQKKVADVLRVTAIDKLDFFLEKDHLEVSPKRMKEVADAIEQNRIDVVVASTGALLSAAYSPHSDTMTLGSLQVPDQPGGRAGIVHESVHALVDMFRITQATELSDEVAAYLAEVIFRRATGVWVQGNAAAMAIYNAADAIVKTHGLGKGKQVRLKWAQYLPLRQAIHAHPAYSGIGLEQLTSGHGIP
jgi:hypothetical protein